MAGKRKKPLVEQTDSRGLVEVEAPGVRLCFPATNRSVMVIACTMIASLAAICFAVAMLGAWAPAENLRSLGAVIRRGGKPDEGYRPAEAVPVENDDGEIEIIHACPPLDCEEDCPCECDCPVCPLPPAWVAPTPVEPLKLPTDAGAAQ